MRASEGSFRRLPPGCVPGICRARRTATESGQTVSVGQRAGGLRDGGGRGPGIRLSPAPPEAADFGRRPDR
jgi:hypothetical protein